MTKLARPELNRTGVRAAQELDHRVGSDQKTSLITSVVVSLHVRNEGHACHGLDRAVTGVTRSSCAKACDSTVPLYTDHGILHRSSRLTPRQRMLALDSLLASGRALSGRSGA